MVKCKAKGKVEVLGFSSTNVIYTDGRFSKEEGGGGPVHGV